MSAPPFWKALEDHGRWQRANLPGIDTRQGSALLVWLLRNDGRPRPIGQLYRESSRSSEPTMRDCVKAFVEHGLALIERDPGDSRIRLLRGTAKLRQVVQEYRQRIGQLAEARSSPC